MSTKKILSPIPKKRRNFIIAVTLLLAGMIFLAIVCAMSWNPAVAMQKIVWTE